MKIKKKMFLILTLSLSFICSLSTVAFAGTLYTGPTYDYDTGKDGMHYGYHLSASANTDFAPNQVVSDGFGQSTSAIDAIEVTTYIFKNDNTVVASDHNRRTDTDFSSVYAKYSGWPSGATYCWGSLSAYFQDSYYGNFLGTDTSDYLYK